MLAVVVVPVQVTIPVPGTVPAAIKFLAGGPGGTPSSLTQVKHKRLRFLKLKLRRLRFLKLKLRRLRFLKLKLRFLKLRERWIGVVWGG